MNRIIYIIVVIRGEENIWIDAPTASFTVFGFIEKNWGRDENVGLMKFVKDKLIVVVSSICSSRFSSHF